MSADWFPTLDGLDDQAADRIDLAFAYIFDHHGDPTIRLAGAAGSVSV